MESVVVSTAQTVVVVSFTQTCFSCRFSRSPYYERSLIEFKVVTWALLSREKNCFQPCLFTHLCILALVSVNANLICIHFWVNNKLVMIFNPM
jgi:hypothetical protein